jgi:hypothetical protein
MIFFISSLKAMDAMPSIWWVKDGQEDYRRSGELGATGESPRLGALFFAIYIPYFGGAF